LVTPWPQASDHAEPSTREPLVGRVPAPIPAPAFAAPEICPPAEIAKRICQWSLAKTTLPLPRLISLSLLAWAYIVFGAALSTLVLSDGVLGHGTMRWLAGIAFSLGLVLVVVGGAELSTGNCLMALAWRARFVTARQMMHNWLVSFLLNCLAAAILAWVIVASGAFDAGVVRATAIRITEAKLGLPFQQAFLRGILANMLVCLAVWLTFASQTVMGKLIGIVFPISAFVALGFEHSVANCFALPAGLLLGAPGTVAGVLTNLTAVTLGNVVGGAVCVALMLGHAHTDPRPPHSNRNR
jgi:formate transporter